MTVLALLWGYLMGGIPTADWLARRRGIDLRHGSGNPGANNAFRLGGRRLGATVLSAEIAKGALAVWCGRAAGDPGVVAAGVGAVLGNVHNPYRRLRGGQGLGIAAGVLLIAAPLVGLAGIAALAVVVIVTRRSAPATLVALVVLVAVAVWAPAGPWGLGPTLHRLALAVGLGAVIAPRQWRLVRTRGRPRHPTPG